jgi:hypothetical protein
MVWEDVSMELSTSEETYALQPVDSNLEDNGTAKVSLGKTGSGPLSEAWKRAGNGYPF